MTMHRPKRTRRLALALAAAATFALTASACTNPEVPAGHEGYVYYRPLVFGKMEYRESLRGPASTGVAWRLFTTNIDMRQRTYTELFQLLTLDNLSIKFEVNTAIKLRDGKVRRIVEEYGGTHWYDWRVKEPLRTSVRRAVALERADQIQTQTQKIAKEIMSALTKRYAGTPVEIRSVDIGHIEFPKPYARAIRKKIAKTEELKRQAAELLKTEEEAKKKVVNALNVARAQRIISESLSPLYVQWRAVQVYKKLAGSQNRAIMLLPNTPDGTGMPQVLSKHSVRRKLSAKDEAYLKRMREKHYDQKTLTDMRRAVNELKKKLKREAERDLRRRGGALAPSKKPEPKKAAEPKKAEPKKAEPKKAEPKKPADPPNKKP